MISDKDTNHLLGAVENYALKTSDYAERHLRHELSKAQIPDGVRESGSLSVAMEVLYKVATCEGHCRKGDHIIESLAACGFNLASSAMILTSIGYYDEALNLIRSLGELTNLLGYLVLYPDEYPSWVLASKKERLSKYSPAAIRRAINQAKQFAPAIEEGTYAELCEMATQVTSKTAPQRSRS